MATALSLTDQVIQERLTQVLEPRFSPTEFRLSETGACPRLRVLRVLGYESEPPTEEEARYFERGHVAENWVVAQYRRKYPRRTRRQITVATPWGDTGHIDLWVPVERKIVEVKSVSRNAFDHALPRDADLDQVQAYLHFFTDSAGQHRTDDAELVYVDMDTLRTQVFPVKRDYMMGISIARGLEYVHKAVEERRLPPVVYFPDEPPCLIHTPSGPKRCGFWKHCHSEGRGDLSFDTTIQSAEGFEETAREYLAVKAQIDAIKKEAEEKASPLECRLEQIRASLEFGLDAINADKVECGDYLITRTRVPGRVIWDVDSAFRAGVVGQDVLAALTPYCREGKEHTRFNVRLKKGGVSSAKVNNA